MLISVLFLFFTGHRWHPCLALMEPLGSAEPWLKNTALSRRWNGHLLDVGEKADEEIHRKRSGEKNGSNRLHGKRWRLQPPIVKGKFFPSHVFIELISVLVCFVFFIVHIHICLQFLGALPQTPTGTLLLDPTWGLLSPKHPSCPPPLLTNSWVRPKRELNGEDWSVCGLCPQGATRTEDNTPAPPQKYSHHFWCWYCLGNNTNISNTAKYAITRAVYTYQKHPINKNYIQNLARNPYRWILLALSTERSHWDHRLMSSATDMVISLIETVINDFQFWKEVQYELFEQPFSWLFAAKQRKSSSKQLVST